MDWVNKYLQDELLVLFPYIMYSWRRVFTVQLRNREIFPEKLVLEFENNCHLNVRSTDLFRSFFLLILDDFIDKLKRKCFYAKCFGKVKYNLINSHEFISVKYIRNTQNCLIGIYGDKEFALKIKKIIFSFLLGVFQLNSKNIRDTLINAFIDRIFFLKQQVLNFNQKIKLIKYQNISVLRKGGLFKVFSKFCFNYIFCKKTCIDFMRSAVFRCFVKLFGIIIYKVGKFFLIALLKEIVFNKAIKKFVRYGYLQNLDICLLAYNIFLYKNKIFDILLLKYFFNFIKKFIIVYKSFFIMDILIFYRKN